MSSEIHQWLAELCGDNPAAARVLGQGLVALISAGARLPPPIVTPVPGPLILNPAEALDDAWEVRETQLGELRHRTAEARSLTQDIESQITGLESLHARLAGHEPEASAATDQLAALRRLLPGAIRGQRILEQALLRSQAAASAFRIRKEVLKARCTVAAAEVAISESLGEPNPAATTSLREVTREIERELRHGSAPDGLLELRAGPHGHASARVLFAVEPADSGHDLGDSRERSGRGLPAKAGR